MSLRHARQRGGIGTGDRDFVQTAGTGGLPGGAAGVAVSAGEYVTQHWLNHISFRAKASKPVTRHAKLVTVMSQTVSALTAAPSRLEP